MVPDQHRHLRLWTRCAAFVTLAVVTVGCRATVPSSSAVAPGEEAWSRIVVHASLDSPVELRLRPGVALVGGVPNAGGQMPLDPFERAATVPVEGTCRMRSVCTVEIHDRLVAIVFAFDPVVEIDVVPPSRKGDLAEVRYRDATSVSATLAEINERSAAVEAACRDTAVQRARRIERARVLEHDLRQLATRAKHEVIERAAWLALVQSQCTQAPENRAIAEQLLDRLEPTASELGPWTDAVYALGTLTGESARAEALVDAVIERHPDPAVGARLLFLRLVDLGDHGDPRARETLVRRLESPRFARTSAATVAKRVLASRRSIALMPGDPWPEIDLHAQEFVATRGPIPGDVAWTDQRTREQLKSRVMRYVALPSFVLVDADGIVVATSNETELSRIEAYSSEFGGSPGDEVAPDLPTE